MNSDENVIQYKNVILEHGYVSTSDCIYRFIISVFFNVQSHLYLINDTFLYQHKNLNKSKT